MSEEIWTFASSAVLAFLLKLLYLVRVRYFTVSQGRVVKIHRVKPTRMENADEKFQV